MRQGPKGPPPLWIVVLVVVGLLFAAVTIRAPGVRGMSALLAAFLGAFAALVFTEWRQARQRVTARMGYARLLDAEIEANEPVVNQLNKHRGRFFIDLHKYGGYIPPSIEVWPEISVKLAPLIEADEFASINDYYRQLRFLVDLEAGRALGAAKGQPVSNFLDEVNPLTQEARRLLSKHANPPQRVRWFGFWW
jgi:hypothetical protein